MLKFMIALLGVTLTLNAFAQAEDYDDGAYENPARASASVEAPQYVGCQYNASSGTIFGYLPLNGTLQAIPVMRVPQNCRITSRWSFLPSKSSGGHIFIDGMFETHPEGKCSVDQSKIVDSMNMLVFSGMCPKASRIN